MLVVASCWGAPQAHYDEGFKSYLENNNKTMWLFAKNAHKDLKNQEMLIPTSKHKNNPIARLDCTYDMNRLTKEKQQSCACLSHFNMAKYLKHTDICVGARQELPSQLLISSQKLVYI
jgi:hypothetical protein